MIRLFLVGSLLWWGIPLWAQNDFSFVFLTDMHLNHDTAVKRGFEKVVVRINELKPDFVVSGGDMIYTAKDGNEQNATRLFNLADTMLHKLNMPVYYTLGNHELVGVLPNSGIDPSNKFWGKGMFRIRYAQPYYSFTRNNYKFFVLDGFRVLASERRYVNVIDSAQIAWIKNELAKTDKSTPIVIAIHPPLVNPKAMSLPAEHALSQNSAEVLSLFNSYNLRMVLQGHNHVYMDLFINGKHFISGGTPTRGANQNSNNLGFVYITVKNGKEEMQFISTLSL